MVAPQQARLSKDSIVQVPLQFVLQHVATPKDLQQKNAMTGMLFLAMDVLVAIWTMAMFVQELSLMFAIRFVAMAKSQMLKIAMMGIIRTLMDVFYAHLRLITIAT